MTFTTACYVNYGQPINDWLSAGVNIFTPYGLGSAFRNNPQQFGYDTATMIGMTNTVSSAAFRISDKLSLGVGLGLGFAMFKYEAPFDINRNPTPLYTENNGYGFGINYNAGVVYQPCDTVTIGVNYMSETEAHIDGKTKLSLGPIEVRDDFDTYFTFPAKLDGAVAWKVGEKTMVAADVNYFNFSKTPNGITLKMDRLGIKKSSELNWRDNIGMHIGVSHKLSDRWTIRGGGGYMQKAIPDDYVNTLTVDVNGWNVAGGTTYRFTDTFSLDFSVTHGFGHNVVGKGLWQNEEYGAAITTFALAGNFEF